MVRLVGRVGLARRNLLADGRRLAAGVLGVALALMLVLLLEGLWEGLLRQAQIYPDRSGAQLFVTQPGVANFLGDSATIPRSTVESVRATPGVRWADPVRGQWMVSELHGRKLVSYIVGYEPGRHGGPWSLKDGRAVRRDNEVVIDRVVARRHALGVGEKLDVGGQQFRIVGIADASGVMTGFIFMTHDASDTLLRSRDTTSFVLVGTARPNAVQARLEQSGLNVLTSEQIAANDKEFYASVLGSVVRLMIAVAFVVGVLVVGLSIYASVAQRRREYGIVKALGGSSRTITGVVVRQTLVLTSFGLAVGFTLFFGARVLIFELRPQFSVVLTPGGITVAVVAAVLMALLASVVPAHRVASVEPAVVYRER